ncbi:hypothetical protein [Vallicoccus soli]|uniref:Uncharacterized protein n=1 Tax=Vallicoccus soli TaxID=2339232 RepID=A0A3A3ZKB5_9ACTN|nr:hypothetical protein [Vallicoccus soli]RJK96324.1 hypothetical protein D5H78_08750 [Vallicoccus soli]
MTDAPVPEDALRTGEDEGEPGERGPVAPDDLLGAAAEDDAPLPPSSGAVPPPPGGPGAQDDGMTPAFLEPGQEG